MSYEWRAVCKKGVRTQLFRNPLRGHIIRIFFCVLRPAVGKSVRQAVRRASGRRGVLHLKSPLQKRRENSNPHLVHLEPPSPLHYHSRQWSPLPPLPGHEFVAERPGISTVCGRVGGYGGAARRSGIGTRSPRRRRRRFLAPLLWNCSRGEVQEEIVRRGRRRFHLGGCRGKERGGREPRNCWIR